ncbi:unnamed protein product, partial [Mesorhabditis belari]|uniref:C3H1-type domain-containing protein n=1 Tax=Mesorhabditis belari TaxID=2138241 RepID=A0AAF3ERL8_9BILA
MPTNNNHFKTKMCRETASGEVCGRGDSCGFAHSPHELRRDGPPPLIARGMNGPPPSLQNIPMNGFPYQNQQHHLITEMQGMTMNPMLPAAPFVQIPTQPPPMSQQEPPMMSMIMQMGAPGVPIPIDRTIPLGPAIPPPIVLMQPPPLWNGRVPPSQPPPPPGTHLILPQITQQIPWIQQVPMAEYPPNAPTPGLYWSGPSQIQVLSPQPINFVQTIPMMIPPPMDHSFEKTSGDETELLHLKRIEILNRLAPLSSLDEEGEEGDGRGHVSYTVASSVLDDSHRHPSFIGIIPINNGNVSLDLPSVPCNVFSCNTEGDLPNFIPTLRIPPGGSPIMATVQADCSSMTVKDAIRQPITASMITPHVTITSPLPPSANPIQQLPTRIIRPIEIPMIAGGAQHFVSQTLDKIVDVKERLIEVSGPSSSVESEQLRVELLIADRQMEALDPHTQQTCLLIELEEVERKIGELGGNHPPPFTPANVIFKNERCIEPKATTKAITKPHH